MKIAVFHNLPFGGAKRVLFEELKVLSKDHEIYLYELSNKKDELFDLEKFSKKRRTFIFTVENSFPLFLNRLYADFKKIVFLNQLEKKIANEIDGSNYDVVLVHPDFYTQAPFILKHLRTKTVYYCHELLRIAYEKELKLDKEVFFFKRWYEEIIRFLLKKIDKLNASGADLILTNSAFIKEKIKNAYKKDAVICYPGVNSVFFDQIFNIKKTTILLAGEEERVFGNNFLRELKTRYEDRYQITTLNQAQSRLSDEYIRKMYSRSLVTVCLSLNEPFGMIPLESMSCKTPVIALNEGGYKETVINGRNGFLINRNLGALEEKINYFISNPKDYLKMGESGREHAISKFSWKTHMKILEKALGVV